MDIGSKEFNLLCASAGVGISPRHAARIAVLTNEGIHWNELLRLAEYHGVLSLVARTLREQNVETPEGIRESLRNSSSENLKRNLWFASELGRILERIKKSNLPAIPYKGPVLAESAYGDLALRNFSDLDILISNKNLAAAREVLADLGYKSSESWSPAVERFWLANGYEIAFDGKAGEHLVELQWAVLPRLFAVDLRNENLLDRSTKLSVARTGARSMPANLGEIPALCPEDSLLVLCLHAAKHLWMRLMWLCDVAETMRSQAIDYQLIETRARRLGILRMVGVSFWLAERVLGAELKPEVRRFLTSDREIPVLGNLFADRLARGASYNFESAEYFLLIRRLRERRLDRWRYLWRLVWTPGVGDLNAARLPEMLFPLYHAIRLGRLARKLVGGSTG